MLNFKEIKKMENELVDVEGSEEFVSISINGNPFFELWDNLYHAFDIEAMNEREKSEWTKEENEEYFKVIEKLEKLKIKRI